ncbi:DUF2855 family protein [Actinoplanes sp. CA-030573]|uniref:DUF2855 family protein n=1 Tax=Actinoplanes sp. CA-030573 TaxID=3239898 RepID=UPI003D9118E1
MTWVFAVDRNDLEQCAVSPSATPEPAEGEAVLRVDRVGMTANNITYAVLGEAMRYWEFFPPAAYGLGPERGLPPLWGFADVLSSTVPGVFPGQRFYGYLPPAAHLVVRPGRVDATGFHDVSPHRAELPSPYNSYRLTTGDPAYRADREDLLILLRPLFYTSFMLADQMADRGFLGAAAVVLSSASSKTAYAAAAEMQGKGSRIIGLTSPANAAFTRSLGCYDFVVTYDDLAVLPPVPTAYLDFSGSADLRRAVRDHLGDQLVRDIAVGLTTRTPNTGAADEFFFAPVQMRKRRQDWGREELDRRFAAAWDRFAGRVSGWLDVEAGDGPEGLRGAWLDVLAGRVPPRVGRVVQL